MESFSSQMANASNVYVELLNTYVEHVELALASYTRLQVLILTFIVTSVFYKIYDIYENNNVTWKSFKGLLFRYFIKLPIIRGIARKELDSVDKSVTKQCRAIYGGQSFMVELPRKGLTRDEIFKLFGSYQTLSHVQFKQGRVSGTVYTDMSSELSALVRDIYGETAYTNPLHPDVFPGINKMEAEIVRMTCTLFNGDADCCGTLTSGGTESIVLAMKAYRDYGRNHRGITKPEMVVPVTAHAAFQKACQYFNIKFKTVPIDPKTFKVDLGAMERAITRNTCVLVGSACEYPHGIIDEIPAIAKLGLKYNIPVHVDCCLGGFLVAFTKAAGYDFHPVDFSLAGVTSISADTHKYAYCPKGSSVIMYSDKKYRKQQFSVQPDWPGGIYASPTISGSRAGANIATCWASMLYHGFDGYVESTRKILKVQRYLKAELRKVKGIYVMGDPMLSVIALGSNDFDIFKLKDLLGDRGWNVNPLQYPSGFHICLTLMHVQEGVADAFLTDVRECTDKCMKDPNKKAEGASVVYGMAQSIPDRSIVSDIACLYLNSIYDTED